MDTIPLFTKCFHIYFELWSFSYLVVSINFQILGWDLNRTSNVEDKTPPVSPLLAMKRKRNSISPLCFWKRKPIRGYIYWKSTWLMVIEEKKDWRIFIWWIFWAENTWDPARILEWNDPSHMKTRYLNGAYDEVERHYTCQWFWMPQFFFPCCVCHVTYRSIAQCYKLQPCVCYSAFAYVTEMFDTHHQRWFKVCMPRSRSAGSTLCLFVESSREILCLTSQDWIKE
jgi:hypothetical protein